MTRFAAWRRCPARALMILLAILIVWPLLHAPAPSETVPKVSGNRASDRADVILYDHIVDRVRAGGNYYAVAAQAQRAGGYPLRPFVTMRPPTLAVLQAGLPGRAAVVTLLWLLVAATVAAWAHRLRCASYRRPQVILGTLLVLGGAATLTLPDLLSWHEGWAALMIALSLAVRSDRRFAASAGIGLVAVLIREIAIVYPLVMLGMALVERRWREASVWSGVVLTFALFIAWHASQVAAVARPDDLASPSWVAMGGWRFVVTMLWLTGPWRVLPLWVASACIPLALLGWGGERSATATRATLLLVTYLVMFTMVGRANNFYWGFLVAPLLPLGLLMAPKALVDLSRAAR